jgi:hypothetical protein
MVDVLDHGGFQQKKAQIPEGTINDKHMSR